jgi:hypothetical protein
VNSLGDRRLFRRLLLGSVGLGSTARRFALEMFDEARQRIGSPIINEVVTKLANRRIDLEVRNDFFGMDERAIQACLDAMMQEDRVQRGASVGPQAERNVGDPKRGERALQLALDEANSLDRFDGGVQELGLAGCQREGEIVEDQRAWRKTVLADGNLIDSASDFELALRRFRHSAFVDRQGDDRRTMLARKR